MLGIKKLDLFIVKNFCLLFAGTFFICLFIFMMQFLWRYVDDLIGKGLSMDVLGKFFYYAGLTLIPTSLPLAILLAALISFGNLGERLELLAIKAAGIPLIKVFRPLTLIIICLTALSFYFQNVVGPDAFTKLSALLWSMKQTSPELEIPEGVFYDEIEGYNVYVKSKDKQTGTLHDVMIYSFAEGFDNARIILADSGRLKMSADKQHLVLNLYHGEQFENLQNMRAGAINIPYRRETFIRKQTLINFNGGFQMQDASILSGDSRAKNMRSIKESIDSMNVAADSIGRQYYKDLQRGPLMLPQSPDKHLPAKVPPVHSTEQAQEPAKTAQTTATDAVRSRETVPFDSILPLYTAEERIQVQRQAQNKATAASSDLEFKALIMREQQKNIARHWIEWHRKITLSLACLVFFFIGAPLGAIIRKGGLGLPVIISVLIFIVYYIIDNTAYRAARNLEIPSWFGMWLSTCILVPVGAFLTYKANRDSMVFNLEAYRNFFRKVLGLRIRRTLTLKEVFLQTPDYPAILHRLDSLDEACRTYARQSRLIQPPNYFRIFWRNEPDEEVEEISRQLEELVEELSNSRSSIIIGELNNLPVLMVHAHTSPFGVRWKNALAGLLLPVGIVLYFRIWRFRFRLLRDMRQIIRSNAVIRQQSEQIIQKQYKNRPAYEQH